MSDINTAGAENIGEVTLSTGVVVRGQRVLDEVMIRAFEFEQSKTPKVPMWLNPEKGRSEPNPDDPDYIAAVKALKVEVGRYMIRSLIMYGITIVRIPEGFPGPDSAEWAEEIELTRMASGKGAIARRYDWLMIKAAPLSSDRTAIMQAAGRATGTLEDDVTAAFKSV